MSMIITLKAIQDFRMIFWLFSGWALALCFSGLWLAMRCNRKTDLQGRILKALLWVSPPLRGILETAGQVVQDSKWV